MRTKHELSADLALSGNWFSTDRSAKIASYYIYIPFWRMREGGADARNGWNTVPSMARSIRCMCAVNNVLQTPTHTHIHHKSIYTS